MFTHASFWQRALRTLALRLFYWVENNYRVDFNANGEARFLQNLMGYCMDHRPTPWTFFDVGANKGHYIQLILDMAPTQALTVHAFEPTQACMAHLRAAYDGHPCVVLNPFGVSDREASVSIYYDQPGSGLASLYPRQLEGQRTPTLQTESIQLIPLERYIQEQNIDHIHFLKLDIEGHELAALSGLGRYLSPEFIDFIQFEYGGANVDSRTYLRDFYHYLEPGGFVIAKILPQGLQIRPYRAYMENFQYANYVAISQPVLSDLQSG